MKILVAADSFKDSISSSQLSDIILAELGSENCEVLSCPMADGGEGTLEVIAEHLEVEKIEVDSLDPLLRKIKSHYYISNKEAYIEVASNAGLALLKESERDPMLSSSLGTGLLYRDAIARKVKKIHLFLGGSATNDAGMGIAHGIGFRFYNHQDQILVPCGINLSQIQRIDPPEIPYSDTIKVLAYTDVQNPFCGPQGAAFTYAKQKGASDEEVISLDHGLAHFAEEVERTYGKKIKNLVGAGAAGGIAGGLHGLLNVKISPAFDKLASLTNLESKIQAADLVITGEGKLDETTLNGKLVHRIHAICKDKAVPLAIFCGKNNLPEDVYPNVRIYSIMDLTDDKHDAMSNVTRYVTQLCGALKKDLNIQ